ncbi:MAG: alpha/beta fold hydrolase [Deltaproteobacteria bacterium]|nr:alpha/beta fold hydrolase [Deltaproteobacteria bacterium]
MKPAAVVLLHGILRSGLSMRPLESALKDAGYRVLNVSYPSRALAVPALAEWLTERIDRAALQEPLGFVTHSMGGVVMRAYLMRRDAKETARAVMIAPPNKGAVEADRSAQSWLYRRVLGPAVLDLQTKVQAPDPPPCAFAVIAGGTGTAHGYSARLLGDNDGRVRVDETKLDGMSDFLLVPRRHTFIMHAPEVIEAALRFLESGQLKRSS